MPGRKLLVVQVAALGYEFLTQGIGGTAWEGFRFRKAQSLFPALTCPVQATMRTGLPPSGHGMVMNGFYDRTLRKPLFWEQSSALVSGARLWNGCKRAGIGMLFWQQSLGEDADILLSPAPVHKHGGGMVEAVYSRPEGLYAGLVGKIGRRFRLSSYWGPRASVKATAWIAKATGLVTAGPEAPDLLFTYLPHLDYDLQRYGPGSAQAGKALADLLDLLKELLDTARGNGYDAAVYGDYSIDAVHIPVHPNRRLCERGLMRTRPIGRRLYPDFHYSRAFAVADHEIAHVYTTGTGAADAAAEALAGLEGVHEILRGEALEAAGIAHANTGDLVLVAEPGAWFAYPWWEDPGEAPDYASHIDIHNKPGYDPCELFFGRHPFVVSTDPARIGGSHGRTGPGTEIAWTSTFEPQGEIGDLPALARMIRHTMGGTA